MAGIVITVHPATMVATGINFRTYANRYFEASEVLCEQPSKEWFDPIPYHLLCQSLELHLKSFIWLTDRLSHKQIKDEYWHDIIKLWSDAKARGINKYCATTPLRDEIIKLVGPFYKDRKFGYLDVSMLFKGIPQLRKEKRALRTLRLLCKQLNKSLPESILRAS